MESAKPINQPSPPLPNSFDYYLKGFIFNLIILILSSLYISTRTKFFNLNIINQALANTGVFLISSSFALSSLSYFWSSWKKKLTYRKYIGIIGFYILLLHGLISLFGLPQTFKFPSYYFLPNNLTPFLLALSSSYIQL